VAVDNLCDLLGRLATDAAAPAGAYFVSDGEDLSTPALIRRIAGALGRPARLLPVPPSVLSGAAKLLGRGEAATRLLGSLQVSLAATRERLGWSPPLDVDAALAGTVRWFRDSREAG
jgi:nucleoside-diphosphate-sugar epimerase